MAVIPLGADTIEAPKIDGQRAELLCIGYGASRVNGLAADFDYDSLAYYAAAPTPPRFDLVELAGEPCASASDPASCSARVEDVRQAALRNDHSHVIPGALLLATGVDGSHREQLEQQTITVSEPTSAPAGDGASAASDVTTIDDIDELLAFLGRIDTPNEAALIMSANEGPGVSCNLQLDGRDYVADVEGAVGDSLCPPTLQRYEMRVTPDGVYSKTAVGSPYLGTGCVGRRPDGLCVAPPADTHETAGRWLARTARLEAAAVAAFVLLARELDALGAPAALITRLRRAAREEIAHAEQMAALARARGAEPLPAVVVPPARRSVLDIALENAVEGCVRECWGALCARFQAEAASAADVRAAFIRVAREEAEHAQLSRDVATWLDARLTAPERVTVATARRDAVDQLRTELDRDVPVDTCAELGLPTRAQALRALDALDHSGILRAA